MTMPSTRLHGVAGAPGLALGPAYVLRTDSEPPTVSERGTAAPDAVREMQRWRSAREQVEDALRRLAERAARLSARPKPRSSRRRHSWPPTRLSRSS
jgi:phosphoenolpyruvate-protein kinase (PTS system EI component)